VITAVVRFGVRQRVGRAKAREMFATSAPKYRGVPGLVRKYYLLSENGRSVGGVYLWRTKQDAERMYSSAWRKQIEKRYGAVPSVTYFESPVIVDNASGVIQED